MIEEKIQVSTSAGTTEAIIYAPEKTGRWPGVIQYTDIGGIRASQEEMARRLAGAGYVVLMPNVFYRTSGLPLFDFPRKFGDERTTRRLAELSAPLTPAAIMSDASDYVNFLARQDSVKPDPMGVVGYCFTGKMALYTALSRPDRIAAAASFHGGGLASTAPDSPHLVLGPSIKARLYFGHATQDKSMPADAIERLNQTLEAWGGKYESEVYEGAFHSWTVPDSPVYNQPQAERAFEKLTQLFAETLGDK
ncbi:MAG TPA: dienelactone hydrolase family protein [Terriglobales bacterium]|nr:dienelactone hydrolase family protein [Terriglobales bacterium]